MEKIQKKEELINSMQKLQNELCQSLEEAHNQIQELQSNSNQLSNNLEHKNFNLKKTNQQRQTMIQIRDQKKQNSQFKITKIAPLIQQEALKMRNEIKSQLQQIKSLELTNLENQELIQNQKQQINMLDDEKSILERENQLLQQKLKQKQVQIDQLELKKDKLRQKFNESKRISQERYQKLQQFSELLKESDKDRQKIKEKYAKQISQIELTLQEQLQKYQTEIENLKQQLENINQEQRKFKKSLLQQDMGNEVLFKQNDQVIDKMDKARKKMIPLEEEYIFTSNLHSSTKSQTHKYQKEIILKEQKNNEEKMLQILKEAMSIFHLQNIKQLLPKLKEAYQALQRVHKVNKFINKLQDLIIMNSQEVTQKLSLNELWKWIKNQILKRSSQQSQKIYENIQDEYSLHQQDESSQEEINNLQSIVQDQKKKIKELTDFLEKEQKTMK